MAERPIARLATATADVADFAAARLRLFGGVLIESGSGGVVSIPGKGGEVLGYVAVRAAGQRSVSRDEVAFRVWPDEPEDAARRALTGTLYRLRQRVPDGLPWLRTERDLLAIDGAWVDVDAFAALAASADPVDWRTALDLYVGELLPAVDADWVDPVRTALQERAHELLGRLTEWQERAGDLAGALASARRRAQADPLDETAHQAVMRLYARLDRHAAALDHYEGLVARLADELGVEPGADTRELAERIRSELDLANRSSTRAPSIPLVGRDDERNRLLEALDRASTGSGGLVAVLGEAGIGKSRLLLEIEASAGWRGWQVSWGRGEEFGLPSPFAPFSDALRAAITPARRDQLPAIVEPVWLDRLAELVPEIGAGQAGRQRDSDTRALAAAIGRVLGGLARLAPQLLLLDDVQWADEATWTLLDGLRPALAEQRVLLVVSGRSDELQAQPVAWERLEAWDRTGTAVVDLHGLEPAGLAALSSALDGQARTSAELERLASASGGNPLLALALLRTGDITATAASLADSAGPRASLDRLFENRLAALSDLARGALEAAAVVGQRFEYGLWDDVADLPDLATLAGELERSGLLRLEGDGYAFTHDTLRSLVIWGLTDDRRQALNRAAFDARRRRTPDDVLALLFHAEQIGATDDIASLAQRAGERSLASLSYGAAVRHFGRVLDVLAPDDREGRYRALLGRIKALDVLADRDAQRADVNELEDLARTLGGADRLVAVAREAAAFHFAVGGYAEGESTIATALPVAVRARDLTGEAALLTILGRILREQGRHAEAHDTVVRARARFERLGDVHGLATATELLAGIAWRLGDHPTAAREHARAAELFEETGDLRRAANSQNSLGVVLWSLGDYEGARATHERSLATCRELGDRRGESDNLDNLGGVAWILADFERAIELYSAALAIRRESSDPRGAAISLINLGDTHALIGEWDAAHASYDEALSVDRSVGVRRNEATALQGKGKALLDAGRVAEARACLDAAVAIHVRLGDRDNLIDAQAALARAAFAAGDRGAARSAIASAVDLLDDRDRAALRQWVDYAAWVVLDGLGEHESALRHLGRAAAAMDEFLAPLPTDARSRVLQRVPIDRLTDEARRSVARSDTVRLPRADVPLGRAVADGDLVTIRWTVGDPADDVIADEGERRRHRLARLVAQAAAQGASPTDDDLAAALGVSRRTVVRDNQALAAAGRPLETRRRSRFESDPPTEP